MYNKITNKNYIKNDKNLLFTKCFLQTYEVCGIRIILQLNVIFSICENCLR